MADLDNHVTIRLSRFDAACLPFAIKRSLDEVARHRRVSDAAMTTDDKAMLDALTVQLNACLAAVTKAMQHG